MTNRTKEKLGKKQSQKFKYIQLNKLHKRTKKMVKIVEQHESAKLDDQKDKYKVA